MEDGHLGEVSNSCQDFTSLKQLQVGYGRMVHGQRYVFASQLFELIPAFCWGVHRYTYDKFVNSD